MRNGAFRRIALAASLALALAVPAAAAPAKGTVVKAVYNPALKTRILTDGRGMSLYVWTADVPKDTSVCRTQGNCAKLWPPLWADGTPVAGPGVNVTLLGTTTDGKQVTYAGHPLYYFHGGHGVGPADKKPAQLNGQGVYQVWYVLSPKGTIIKTIP
jgi:predicted lipoprotein with Yx(FWY)xxD motif